MNFKTQFICILNRKQNHLNTTKIMFARKQDTDQLIEQKKHKWVALYIKHG